MKFQKKAKPFKKCPRCGNRCLANQSRCEECGLLFSRLEFASNKAAKKQLRHFDRDYVIYTKDLPKDVSFVKLLLLCIFTGIMGGHYYYVGKYIKGALMTLVFVFLLVCTIFNAQLVNLLETYYLYAPIGVGGFAWIVSLVYIISRKFKVPVLVDIPQSVEQDMKKQRAEFEKLKNEIAKENQKAESSNQKKNDSAGKTQKKGKK